MASYKEVESSNFEGRPVFLYLFEMNGLSWRYTSADAPVSASLSGRSYTWEPQPIMDDGIRQSGETQADAMKLSMASSVPVAALYLGTPPASPLTVSLFKKHDDSDDVVLTYVGDVAQVDFPSPGTVEFSLVTLSATMDRMGLRLSWMRSCPYALYDTGCLVDKAKYRVTATVLSFGKGDVVLSTDLSVYGDGYFAGGFIEWNRAGRGVDRRGIEAHTGSAITLMGMSDGFSEGDTVYLYPGCTRTAEVCQKRFDNLLNYGGVLHMPGESPFSGKNYF